MSQYYRPRQPQRVPSAHVSAPRAQETEQRLLEIDLEDSIYIFPNPPSSAGSAPSSPSLGSDIPAPTDLTLSHLSRSRSQCSSDHDGFSQTRSSSLSGCIGRRFNVGTDRDPEVEIWDWNADIDSAVVSDESAVDMEEVDHVHRWKFLATPRGRISTSSLWRAQQRQLDSVISRTPSVPRNTHRRHRSVDCDPGPIVPCHHKHIPMLSFIASLLCIDESTIDLLTHSSSQSALFPDHSIFDEHPSDGDDRTLHGATNLFTGLEGNRTLREGLAVACDPECTSFNQFAPPSLQLSGLWSLVNGVWMNSGRVLREAWI